MREKQSDRNRLTVKIFLFKFLGDGQTPLVLICLLWQFVGGSAT